MLISGFYSFVLASQAASSAPSILIPQVPRNQAMRASPSAVAPQISPEATAAAQEAAAAQFGVDDQGRIRISRAIVEACVRTRTGGPPPEGVDCQPVLVLADAETRRTAEGSLLRLLGQQEDVTNGSA